MDLSIERKEKPTFTYASATGLHPEIIKADKIKGTYYPTILVSKPFYSSSKSATLQPSTPCTNDKVNVWSKPHFLTTQ